MGKIGFVFPGQGAQYSGMGKDFYSNLHDTREIFDIGDKIRKGTSGQCFFASEKTLSETDNTQPCIFMVEMAAAIALTDRGIVADAVAGFSLGEISALTYSEVFDLNTGFNLVCTRGEIMSEAAKAHNTFMAAVLNLSDDEIINICGNFHQIYPVNFNCGGQVSVAGEFSEMKEFEMTVKKAGGRMIPLKVGGGFHSCFMDKAAESFGKILDETEFSEAVIPVYSNYSGKIYGEDASVLLKKQMNNPVRWREIIENMIDDGINQFIEVGPGTTLSSMIKRIDRGVSVSNVQDKKSLIETIKMIEK